MIKLEIEKGIDIMKSFDYKTILKCILPILICLSSFCMVAQKTSTPKFHEQSIQYLDEKRNTVMTLAASSAAISTAITILPGDTGTPIANGLADLSSKFLLVLGAIYLEKYALTLTCMVTFKYIIPIICLAWLINNVTKWDWLRIVCIKIGIMAVAMCLIVPCSVKLSKTIEATYETSIQETIDHANNIQKKIKKDKENKNFIEKAAEAFSSTAQKYTKMFNQSLNNFMEATAIMIVTSCVIPILVILFFLWFIQTISGMTINTKRLTTFNPVSKVQKQFINSKE